MLSISTLIEYLNTNRINYAVLTDLQGRTHLVINSGIASSNNGTLECISSPTEQLVVDYIYHYYVSFDKICDNSYKQYNLSDEVKVLSPEVCYFIMFLIGRKGISF